MLKGFHVLAHIERKTPGTLDWWIGEEDAVTEMIAKGESKPGENGARFTTEYSYREIQRYAQSSAELPDISDVAVEDCTGEVCMVGADGEIDDTMIAWLIDQLAKTHAMPIPKEKVDPAMGDLFDG